MTHLPGKRNQMDPLSRRGFADGDTPTASMGDPDPESQQELFSRPSLSRDSQQSHRPMWYSLLFAQCGHCGVTHCRVATVAFAHFKAGGTIPSAGPRADVVPPSVMVCLSPRSCTDCWGVGGGATLDRCPS